VLENITLIELKASCPQFAITSVCTEGSARDHGALLYNSWR